ncbi:MAG: alkaline phosphatase family protein [Acidobacteriota bacterium]|nr:alkaline phosphatase family protein [Acidobacteriota bacterium]
MSPPLRLLTMLVLICVVFFSGFSRVANSKQQTANSKDSARHEATTGRLRHQASTQGPRQNATTQRPRLILLIVVDQFRYDYLERFGDLFGPRGIKRLVHEGAFWVNANFDYTPTKTAPGHAAIMTGAPPAATGMVGNEWIERDSHPAQVARAGNPVSAKKVLSVTDDTVKGLGDAPNESAYSPRRLLASTLGDELRLATNDRAKVIGISDKPRSAILMAGHHANGAYWLSSETDAFVSSDYYFPQLPGWVSEFNRARPADKYFGAKWERLLPESEYLKRAGPDSPPWENIGEAKGETNAFPHTITGGAARPNHDFYDALDHSPFLNELLVSFVKQAITSEQLGQDSDTDALLLSLSADDHVGHRFGPYSQEVMDVTLRVDRDIAGLLDFVDARVGLSNTVVIFTADHGVSPIPEHAAALGLGGARIPFALVLNPIREAISARYNRGRKSPDPTADYILKYDDDGKTKDGIINGNVYFNLAALQRDGVNVDEIEEVAGRAALTVPGIARYFTRSQLQHDAASSTDPIARRVLHGFYPGRSGDVIIVQEPFKYFGDSADPTNHGTPYSYDTHVPMIIMGSAFRSGRYLQAAAPTDIASTLAAVLGVEAPSSSTGRVLIEGLETKRANSKQ